MTIPTVSFYLVLKKHLVLNHNGPITQLLKVSVLPYLLGYEMMEVILASIQALSKSYKRKIGAE